MLCFISCIQYAVSVCTINKYESTPNGIQLKKKSFYDQLFECLCYNTRSMIHCHFVFYFIRCFVTRSLSISFFSFSSVRISFEMTRFIIFILTSISHQIIFSCTTRTDLNLSMFHHFYIPSPFCIVKLARFLCYKFKKKSYFFGLT